jgi:hypothetical protein
MINKDQEASTPWLARDFALAHIQPLFFNQKQTHELISLPVRRSHSGFVGWGWLPLPSWASHLVPASQEGLFLPKFSEAETYLEYDWFRAIEFYATLQFELRFEEAHGPTHSYSKKLDERGWPAFDNAWVNRIAAFLKLWRARQIGKDPLDHFGEMPQGRVFLTHDVDALVMTPRMRVKQATSLALSGQYSSSAKVFLNRDKRIPFETILSAEAAADVRSIWLLFAQSPRHLTSPLQNFLNPQYSLSDKKLIEQIRGPLDRHTKGLHSSFASWDKAGLLRNEKLALDSVLGYTTKFIRQHWLRFSLRDTWRLQYEAGFSTDFTLGFNDRTGFRASTTLPLHPLNNDFSAVSTVIMDSNLFTAAINSPAERNREIDRILDEIESFGGQAAINWHPHTFLQSYGWGETYNYLLDSLSSRKIEVFT